VTLDTSCLLDNLLPELKLKQSNILTMGDFYFDLQNKNFRFSEFMEHTFSSKQLVSKVTRKYESLLDLGIFFKSFCLQLGAAWNKSGQLAWYFLRRTT
jgi:hypothetical protein